MDYPAESPIPDCIKSGISCDGECCDECDYLICCTNYKGLCDQCLAENGACLFNIILP